MKRRRYKLVVGLGALAVILACAGMLPYLQRSAERTKCQHTMRALQTAVLLYGSDYPGQFPPNLEVLMQTQQISPGVLVCPKVGEEVHKGEMQKGTYTYINWSARPRGADWDLGKHPLFYDSRFSNHGGEGINVVTMDGTAWWDAHAQWLQKFAAQHPDADLPTPQ